MGQNCNFRLTWGWLRTLQIAPLESGGLVLGTASSSSTKSRERGEAAERVARWQRRPRCALSQRSMRGGHDRARRQGHAACWGPSIVAHGGRSLPLPQAGRNPSPSHCPSPSFFIVLDLFWFGSVLLVRGHGGGPQVALHCRGRRCRRREGRGRWREAKEELVLPVHAAGAAEHAAAHGLQGPSCFQGPMSLMNPSPVVCVAFVAFTVKIS